MNNQPNQMRIGVEAELIEKESGKKLADVSPNTVVKSPELLESQHKYLSSKDDDKIVRFNKLFFKTYPEMLSYAASQLTNPEFVFMMSVLPKYVCFNDHVLRSGGHTKGEPMTAKLIAEREGMSVNTVRNLLTSLKNKYVLAYVTSGGDSRFSLLESGKTEKKLIVANPFIFTRGAGVNQDVLSIFHDTTWEKIFKDMPNLTSNGEVF